MIEPGNFGKKNVENVNEQILSLKGELSMKDAQIWLGKFLKSNLGFCFHYLTGEFLFPVQIMMLKVMWLRDYTLVVCSRGFSKSWIAAVFALLYAIFNPGVKIVVLASSFRQAKGILKYVMKLAESPGAKFLRTFFNTRDAGIARRANEEWDFTIGTSHIYALPLGDGGKIRGVRANVIIIDEFLEMPKTVVEDVITPFLVVNEDPVRRSQIFELETKLIKQGKMTEDERTKFKNPKLICLSSASFKFEYLYERFQLYLDKITNPDNKDSLISYGIINLGHQAAPSQLLSEAVIEDARANMSEAAFQKEYMAQFPDDSSGYFKMQKLQACRCAKTPIIELIGERGREYILAIDPNYKDQENSDHFAMCLLKLSENRKTWTQVHTFAMAQSALKITSNYLHYLLTHFNIVYIIGDDSGTGRFLEYCNDTPLFASSNIKLKPIEASFVMPDSPDYIKRFHEIKASYNKEDYRIVHYQPFNAGKFLQNANMHLQASIGHQRLRFAAQPLEELYQQTLALQLPLDKIKFEKKDTDEEAKSEKERIANKMINFIDNQIELITLTIQECALIEMSISSDGHQSFDLPKSMRNQTAANKARKDSYTALLLANWGAKCYQEIMAGPVEEEKPTTFLPVFVR